MKKKYTIEEVIDLLNQEFPDKREFYECDLEEFADKYHLQFNYGETRWCFQQSHWTEVIKIPRFDNVDDDYGAIEVYNYIEACKRGIGKIFLPTRYLCTLQGDCPVYVQTKFTCEHSQYTHPRYNHKDLYKITGPTCYHNKICMKAYRGMYQAYRLEYEWFARAYQIYGKKFMGVLENFTKELSIGDLHSRNIGWLGKQPIILDYAGYHG